jgi:hypothetical protein
MMFRLKHHLEAKKEEGKKKLVTNKDEWPGRRFQGVVGPGLRCADAGRQARQETRVV